jgi:uncharacterized Ntn-hydrolase superfamily protein
MTYSIVARDPETGDLGVAVQTHQPAVGAIVPWVKGGLGAIATQASANISFGPDGLALLEKGRTAAETLTQLLAGDSAPELRQLAIIAAEGPPAVHTGAKCMAFASHQTGEHYSVQANIMARDTVPAAMARAFEASEGHLAVRMLRALEAAQSEGGDLRGMQSAALLVRQPHGLDFTWNLRIDNDREPLSRLSELIDIRRAGRLLATPPPGESAPPLAELLSNLARAQALHPSDEQLYWFAIRGLAPLEGALPHAIDILEGVFKRGPQWRTLLHRLEGLESLKARFPE